MDGLLRSQGSTEGGSFFLGGRYSIAEVGAGGEGSGWRNLAGGAFRCQGAPSGRRRPPAVSRAAAFNK